MPGITRIIAISLLSLSIAGSLHQARAAEEAQPGAQPAEEFRQAFLAPILGDRTACVIIATAADGWMTLTLSRSKGCAPGDNRLLAAIARPGKHQVIVRRGGFYRFGSPFLLGPAPKYEPARTFCIGSDCKTVLLDPRDGLGFLPGALVSTGRDEAIDAPRVFVHEAGHWRYAYNSVKSDDESLEMENWYVYSRNPGAAMRLYHSLPAEATSAGMP